MELNFNVIKKPLLEADYNNKEGIENVTCKIIYNIQTQLGYDTPIFDQNWNASHFHNRRCLI